MFLKRHSGFHHCVPWQILLWVLLFGLLPRCLLLCCFLDETQIWLGDLRVLAWFVVMFCFDLPSCMDQWCPCTILFLTAYAHVRTEPQSDIGHTRRKKRKKNVLKRKGRVKTPVQDSCCIRRRELSSVILDSFFKV